MVVEVTWDGLWSADSDEMQRHLVIKQIDLPIWVARSRVPCEYISGSHKATSKAADKSVRSARSILRNERTAGPSAPPSLALRLRSG